MPGGRPGRRYRQPLPGLRYESQPGAAHRNGAWLEAARREKERRYPELLTAERCKLVVVGIEVGGRWDEQGVRLIEALAHHKA